jgi:hypothetical protein
MNLHNYGWPILANIDYHDLIRNSLSACSIPASIFPGLVRASTIISNAYCSQK